MGRTGRGHARLPEPGPGPEVVREGREAGRRVATVSHVEVRGNAVLVGMRLEGEGERWQVLRVGPEGVYDIRGFEDRAAGRRGIVPLSWSRANQDPASHYTVQTVGRARNALAVGRAALARTGCDKEFS